MTRQQPPAWRAISTSMPVSTRWRCLMVRSRNCLRMASASEDIQQNISKQLAQARERLLVDGRVEPCHPGAPSFGARHQIAPFLTTAQIPGMHPAKSFCLPCPFLTTVKIHTAAFLVAVVMPSPPSGSRTARRPSVRSGPVAHSAGRSPASQPQAWPAGAHERTPPGRGRYATESRQNLNRNMVSSARCMVKSSSAWWRQSSPPVRW